MKDKKDKIVIGIAIIVLIILIFNLLQSIYQMIDYESRKELGNDRWLQVENRILQTEEKVKELEGEIKWNK